MAQVRGAKAHGSEAGQPRDGGKPPSGRGTWKGANRETKGRQESWRTSPQTELSEQGMKILYDELNEILIVVAMCIANLASGLAQAQEIAQIPAAAAADYWQFDWDKARSQYPACLATCKPCSSLPATEMGTRFDF